MRGSMSRKGNCWDNAVTETLFGSLKVERLHGMGFETRRQAKDEVIDWLAFYNRRRMHSTLDLHEPHGVRGKLASPAKSIGGINQALWEALHGGKVRCRRGAGSHVAGVQPNARRRHGTASRFPTTLCRWVGEIVQSSPEAARLTLMELIVGALLASDVTQAILALTPWLSWQAYHWMLERFRLLGLIAALCRIVRREIGERRCFVVIDDTLAPRCSARCCGPLRPRGQNQPPDVPAVPVFRHAVRRRAMSGSTALGAAGHRPVPQFGQRRQARDRQGPAARRRRPRACCSTPGTCAAR